MWLQHAHGMLAGGVVSQKIAMHAKCRSRLVANKDFMACVVSYVARVAEALNAPQGTPL